MPNIEIELNPVDFITVGTVGPKGKRIFHLQAGKGTQIVSLTIEKEQAWALGEAIKELIDDLDERYGGKTEVNLTGASMDLRDPVDPLFRVAQLGLGYDEDRNMIVLVAQELVATQQSEPLPEQPEPGVVRMWCTREQMRGLSLHAMEVVKSGRPDPKQNGRLIYYWT